MEEEIAAVSKLVDAVVEFSVAYGFQILGALVVLAIGLKVAGWAGRKISDFAAAKDMDPTLAKFSGSVTKCSSSFSW